MFLSFGSRRWFRPQGLSGFWFRSRSVVSLHVTVSERNAQKQSSCSGCTLYACHAQTVSPPSEPESLNYAAHLTDANPTLMIKAPIIKISGTLQPLSKAL